MLKIQSSLIRNYKNVFNTLFHIANEITKAMTCKIKSMM